MKLLRVDLTKREINTEEITGEDALLGGRGMVAKILSQEVDPAIDPLSEENKLVIAGGIFAGTKLTSSGRLSIGAKSPLTGGIKESNAGGTSADRLARLGYRGIILEGQAQDQLIMVINDKGVSFEAADELQGLGNYETAKQLLDKYPGAGLISVGPAAEYGVLSACVSNTDCDEAPSRVNGRGGMGAVMGLKGIKAIVLDDSQSDELALRKKEQYQEMAKDFSRIVANADTTANYRKYGTSALVKVTDGLGALPTKNFSRGSFEGSDNISGQKMYEEIINRGGEGKTSHSCMDTCVIRCSNIFPDEEGNTLVAPLEYETIGLVGSNLGIDSLDQIARINYKCNDVGVDTIEFGATMGVAMEEGLCEFGDFESVMDMLNEIQENTLLGRLIASGAKVFGKVLGAKRVPVVKGQGLPAYDPRSIKGLGVTYATSPMGADHTAGNTVRAPLKHSKKEGQVEASKSLQPFVAAMDTLGMCVFLAPSIGKKRHLLADLVNARLDFDITEDDLMELGRKVLAWEKRFNEQAGITKAYDDLPEFFRKEENPDSGASFDIDKDELQRVFDDFPDFS
ncbi:aldehyde ferredoxin oxidoreductase C-terminal domain-containing protein [Natranaerobius thermophilus]|uniref:Aldehyde ferredoxin oxidoreductase n=1 Tax=Natranaerobius thermophilus (strain ATCC BAA-1301 / DSM 18059 / JW/NM-WN-LF) TaxID=457570 RepID=B2A8M0_NATTJ|nr:aldehyde ferredoxin oxidoreductase C-terminal domain-containing protein [Natranaerobius thermophilus]ACB85904.1 Aldehyde ferredoxin oxidoreductase [Natranaerobius thermophilus JW/NM-WN-LF]